MSLKRCKSVNNSKSSQAERRHIWDPERELPRHLGYKLVPCKYCSRTFFTNRLDCHQEICRVKQFQPKRPVFDSVKSRLAGTVAEYFQFPIPENEIGGPLNPNWRENRHIYFSEVDSSKDQANLAKVQSLKTEIKGRQLSTLANYIQCPICGRRFNPDVGKRHIAHCTTYVCPNGPTTSKSAAPAPSRLRTRSSSPRAKR